MTQGLTPPSLPGELSSLKKRVTDLERKLNASLSARLHLGIPFSLAGNIYVSESPPWSSPTKLRISTMVVLLGTAGTTTTTVSLKVNGAVVTSTNLPAGALFRKVTLSKELAPDQDLVTIACTAAGSGAKDLDTIIRFA